MLVYWEDMDDKGGFNDGDSVPPDAYAVRAVNIRIVNKLLAKLGSTCRIVAFNRPGAHNPCMLLRVAADYIAGNTEEEIVSGKIEYRPEPPTDEAWDQAIALAENTIDSDEFVEVVVTTHEAELQALLARLDAENVESLREDAANYV